MGVGNWQIEFALPNSQLLILMAFDPTKPANGSPISSAELRDQFAGLKTLLDTKPDLATVDSRIASNTAGSLAAVAYPSFTISDPPTQAEVQALLDKLVEILDAANHA